jgi:hypothetical protein
MAMMFTIKLSRTFTIMLTEVSTNGGSIYAGK